MIAVYSPDKNFLETCKKQCFYRKLDTNISGISFETAFGTDITQTVLRFTWNHVDHCKYQGDYSDYNTTKCKQTPNATENMENNVRSFIFLHIFKENFVMYQENDLPNYDTPKRYIILAKSTFSVYEMIRLRRNFVKRYHANTIPREYFSYIDIKKCMSMEEFCKNPTHFPKFRKSDVRDLAANKALVGIASLIILTDRY